MPDPDTSKSRNLDEKSSLSDPRVASFIADYDRYLRAGVVSDQSAAPESCLYDSNTDIEARAMAAIEFGQRPLEHLEQLPMLIRLLDLLIEQQKITPSSSREMAENRIILAKAFSLVTEDQTSPPNDLSELVAWTIDRLAAATQFFPILDNAERGARNLIKLKLDNRFKNPDLKFLLDVHLRASNRVSVSLKRLQLEDPMLRARELE